MRIFNIIITTKANQRARELEDFQQGWDACKKAKELYDERNFEK